MVSSLMTLESCFGIILLGIFRAIIPSEKSEELLKHLFLNLYLNALIVFLVEGFDKMIKTVEGPQVADSTLNHS